MNRYLSAEKQTELIETQLRSIMQAKGRTVVQVVSDRELIFLRFSDGMCLAIGTYPGTYDNDDPRECSFHNLNVISLPDLLRMGLISDAEFAAAKKKEKVDEIEGKLREIERLQAELEAGE